MSGDLAKQRLFSISVISSSKSGQRGALQQRVCFPTRFSGIDKSDIYSNLQTEPQTKRLETTRKYGEHILERTSLKFWSICLGVTVVYTHGWPYPWMGVQEGYKMIHGWNLDWGYDGTNKSKYNQQSMFLEVRLEYFHAKPLFTMWQIQRHKPPILDI